MKTFTWGLTSPDGDKHILIERDKNGTVVSVSYRGVLLPYEDKIVVDLNEAYGKYMKYNHMEKIQKVREEYDTYGNEIQGIVFGEKATYER